ncbi:MAG TPA: DUF6624 domain-containing protein [Gemmataceae bacterium]|nr:DUF6624 domain-containing protein [Gemmataceae bacterium]
MVRMTGACWLFIALAAFGQDGKAKPKRDEALRQELLKMVKEDQDARKEFVKTPSDAAVRRKVDNIDRKNTARMKEIIDKHGWPGKDLVDDDGARAAWLLVQHADKDRAFQKRCLTLLEKAVKAKQAAAVDLAFLTDRVLVGENKKQIYGTQFREKDGKMEPYPIEDEKNVDRRRKEVGLPSLDEYRKSMEKLYKR